MLTAPDFDSGVPGGGEEEGAVVGDMQRCDRVVVGVMRVELTTKLQRKNNSSKRSQQQKCIKTALVAGLKGIVGDLLTGCYRFRML